MRKKYEQHNMTGSRFYYIWTDMQTRCSNPNNKDYSCYGGSGIQICFRWSQFNNFKEDMYQSYLEHVKKFGEKNTTIERRNIKKNYSPYNCRWATRQEQSCNRKSNHKITYKGKTKMISSWAKELGFKRQSLEARINNYGWSIEKAFTTPIRK